MKTVLATSAPKPKSKMVKWAAWAYAGLLTVMVVGQLFNFENFIPAIAEFYLAGNERMATTFAALIVTIEVFAIPYLIGMTLSSLMRWVSLACSVLVAISWFKLSLFELAYGGGTMIPMFGTKVDALLVPVAAALLLSFVMIVWALYIVRGMWPVRHKH